MNRNQVKGKLNEAAGETQEQAGRLTGNRDQQARGQARESAGKVQKKAGDVASGVKRILKKP